MSKYLSQEKLVELLREEAAKSTQAAVADRLGLSRSAVNEVLSGRADVSKRIAAALGYEREVLFRKVA